MINMARPRSILFVVDSASGCWEWQGALSWNGYGRIKRNGRLNWAHKWYYEEKYGLVPSGLMLDHLCRNTRCVNPDHLEIVTNAENQRRGEAVRLTWEAVEFIRSHYQPGHPEFGQRALGRLFGVTHSTIQEVLKNNSWVLESNLAQEGGQ